MSERERASFASEQEQSAVARWDEDALAGMQIRLSRPPAFDKVKMRTVGGGRTANYMPSEEAITAANEIFGSFGWSCEVKGMKTEYMYERNGRYSCGVSAIMRVTTQFGNFHEDVGFGCGTNLPSPDQAVDKAKKGAITDARKRTLRLFGEALGNSLRKEEYNADVKRARRGGSAAPFNPISAPIAHPPPTSHHPTVSGPSKESVSKVDVEDDELGDELLIAGAYGSRSAPPASSSRPKSSSSAAAAAPAASSSSSGVPQSARFSRDELMGEEYLDDALEGVPLDALFEDETGGGGTTTNATTMEESKSQEKKRTKEEIERHRLEAMQRKQQRQNGLAGTKRPLGASRVIP